MAVAPAARLSWLDSLGARRSGQRESSVRSVLDPLDEPAPEEKEALALQQEAQRTEASDWARDLVGRSARSAQWWVDSQAREKQ